MPSTNILDKPVILEREDKHRDSMGKARAIFLQDISELRPRVINDLHEKVYCEFVYAVAEHFKDELFAESTTTSEKSGLNKGPPTNRGRKLGSKNNPLTGNQILKKFSTV